mgnify:CR=1 FL=1
MSKKQEVILLFTCDQWKFRDSMRLVGIFLDPLEVKKAIKKLIKNGVIELDKENGYELSDIDNYDFEYIINNVVSYLYIHYGYDGEFESEGSYLV